LILDWIQKEKESQLAAPVNHCCTWNSNSFNLVREP
jgi:hypothetical protein